MKPIYYENQVLFLMYHYFSSNESRYVISKERFHKQMDLLYQLGYKAISIEKYFDFVENGKSVPPNAVVITFDDGAKEIYDQAIPILKMYGYPSATFIIPKLIDDQEYNQSSGMWLSWDQIRELKKERMSFYSHTYNCHHYVDIDEKGNQKPSLANRIYLKDKKRCETEDEYRHRIKKDMLLAEKRITAELGNQPKFLCVPYGAYNDIVIEVGNEIGVKLFFTAHDGINHRNDRIVKRLEVWGDMDDDLFLDMIKHFCTPKALR
ncbi:polysaccharide deacetylase family protein [bacterium LRH843]|nr:polysaccharide deacetylase family protein [bacterium LRH843]